MRIGLTVLAASLVIGIAHGEATPIVYSGWNRDLSASASFSLEGNRLTVVLTNTSQADIVDPGHALTGLFFNTMRTLAPLSAVLTPGSTVEYGSITDVGNGWQYISGINAQGKNTGISSAGFGVFGPTGNFGPNPRKLGGVDYGILSEGDDPGTKTNGMKNNGPYVQDSVTFTLLAGPGFSLNELGDSVVFQYGSSLTETSLIGKRPMRQERVPEPSAAVLVGCALLAGLAWLRGRL